MNCKEDTTSVGSQGNQASILDDPVETRQLQTLFGAEIVKELKNIMDEGTPSVEVEQQQSAEEHGGGELKINKDGSSEKHPADQKSQEASEGNELMTREGPYNQTKDIGSYLSHRKSQEVQLESQKSPKGLQIPVRDSRIIPNQKPKEKIYRKVINAHEGGSSSYKQRTMPNWKRSSESSDHNSYKNSSSRSQRSQKGDEWEMEVSAYYKHIRPERKVHLKNSHREYRDVNGMNHHKRRESPEDRQSGNRKNPCKRQRTSEYSDEESSSTVSFRESKRNHVHGKALIEKKPILEHLKKHENEGDSSVKWKNPFCQNQKNKQRLLTSFERKANTLHADRINRWKQQIKREVLEANEQRNKQARELIKDVYKDFDLPMHLKIKYEEAILQELQKYE